MKIKTIDEAFIKEGYISIPFSFNGVGHPIIKVTLSNDVQANFLIDTGASINLIDYEIAKELGITLTPTGEKGAGAGGLAYDIFSIEIFSLVMSEQHFSFSDFYSMDFFSIKESYTSRGISEEIQGILGFSFFKMTNCFIDCSNERIFILNK